jgi:hypothetical protein
MMECVVRRVVGIFLLVAFAAIGTGSLQRLHAFAHEQEDIAVLGDDSDSGGSQAPSHDESNCNLHMLLAAPLLAAGWVPLLVLIGVFVAFLTQLPSRIISQLAPVRIDCRGPPLR